MTYQEVDALGVQYIDAKEKYLIGRGWERVVVKGRNAANYWRRGGYSATLDTAYNAARDTDQRAEDMRKEQE